MGPGRLYPIRVEPAVRRLDATSWEFTLSTGRLDRHRFRSLIEIVDPNDEET